jgi:hypothetical protein
MSTSKTCLRCSKDKQNIKMFSAANNMDPGEVPNELANLSVIEQQLICRIAPCINVHMLNHGGIASSGYCVTFPQEINEPAKIFPRLPHEINIIKVKKHGKNDTCKEFRVRRFKVEHALQWLKLHNLAYSDIQISAERLQTLPEDGELQDIITLQFKENAPHVNDRGPASEQTEINVSEGFTNSGAQLPDSNINIKKQVESILQNVIGDNHGDVSVNKRGTITIPWPTRDNIPVSEFTTQYFFYFSLSCTFSIWIW